MVLTETPYFSATLFAGSPLLTLDKISCLTSKLIFGFKIITPFQEYLNQHRHFVHFKGYLSLSKIYSTLRNPFYYGEFEFPASSGTWYKGRHKPLITKGLFEKVQIALDVPPRDWHSKVFPFKKIFECGGCGGGITAEEKIRKLKHGGCVRHIYYHCGRSANYECNEPYITETDLIKQLIANVNKIKFNQAAITRKIQEDVERYHRLKKQVLHQEYMNGNLSKYDKIPKDAEVKKEMFKNYLLHILKVGTPDERKEALSFIKTKFVLTDRMIKIKK